jgi:hypothetical protein
MFETLWGLFVSVALSAWSKISGSLNVIVGQVADDELQIVHDEYNQFLSDMKAGKSAGEAAADVWTRTLNSEKAELSKVANLILQLLIAPHGA